MLPTYSHTITQNCVWLLPQASLIVLKCCFSLICDSSITLGSRGMGCKVPAIPDVCSGRELNQEVTYRPDSIVNSTLSLMANSILASFLSSFLFKNAAERFVF